VVLEARVVEASQRVVGAEEVEFEALAADDVAMMALVVARGECSPIGGKAEGGVARDRLAVLVARVQSACE
jgi:hypothetical protein